MDDLTALEGFPRLAAGLVLGVLLGLATYVALQALRRLGKRFADRTQTDLDDEFVERMGLPARTLAPVVALHFVAAWMGWRWVVGAVEIVEGLLVTYVAVAAVEILLIERWLARRQGVQVPPLVRQVVIGVVYGCVVLGVAGQVFGIDITPLLATGSVTTVVVGLALQQPLGNLFSGIVLHLERHPSDGDWVLIDGREGQIVQIGWRTTRIRTFTDDLVVVPNAALANAQFVNFSEPTKICGRNLPVPVPLDLAPETFLTWVREVCANIDGICKTPPPKTWLTAIDDHCQRYVVRLWVEEFRRHDDLESDFLKGLWTRFHREGVAWPTPHQAVRMVQGAPPPAFAGLEPTRATGPVRAGEG